jgi:uncharacterized protein (TIGR04255 family)
MPFRPLNDKHAIQEVVFVLTFSRPFKGDEMKRFEDAHHLWEGDLPKLIQEQVVSLMWGSGPPPQLEPPVPGRMFERYKSDGTQAWRLRANNNWLAVNCLAYTRWADIWGRARTLLQQSSDVISSEDSLVVGLALQYVDAFIWEGDIEQYDLRELLREDSEFIPRSLWGRGPTWHLHQGWFRMTELPEVGRRLLERMHLDALSQNEVYVVKFDNTLRLDLRDGVAPRGLFTGQDALIDLVFEQLHAENKRTMAGYLSDPIKERIGLDV